jgi:hypothetical protein
MYQYLDSQCQISFGHMLLTGDGSGSSLIDVT